MKKMWIVIAAVVVIYAVTVVFVCCCKDAEIKEQKTKYSKIAVQLLETSDALDETLSDNILLETENECLKDNVAHYQRIIAELETNAEKPTATAKKEPLFDKHTNVYRCMDYRKITCGDQLALQQDCMTRHNGIRALIVGDELYYCAALGNAFGEGYSSIGRAYKVTLKNGYYFNVVFAEFKHPIPQTDEELETAKTDYGDADCSYMSAKDENGEYIKDCLNVIEFVVDTAQLDEKVKKAGSISAIPAFGGLYSYDGDIVSMEYLGKVWGDSGETLGKLQGNFEITSGEGRESDS